MTIFIFGEKSPYMGLIFVKCVWWCCLLMNSLKRVIQHCILQSQHGCLISEIVVALNLFPNMWSFLHLLNITCIQGNVLIWNNIIWNNGGIDCSLHLQIEKSMWSRRNPRKIEIDTSRLYELFGVRETGRVVRSESISTMEIMLNSKIAHNFSKYLYVYLESFIQRLWGFDLSGH